MNQEQLDKLAALADTAENCASASTIPMPPAIHIQALSGKMEEISVALKDLYREVSGTDPWEGHPLRGGLAALRDAINSAPSKR